MTKLTSNNTPHIFLTILCISTIDRSYAFNSPLFVSTTTKASINSEKIVTQQHQQPPKPVKTKTGIEIELPDFHELFGRIEKVSPLASLVMQNKNGGFNVAIDKETSKNEIKWKKVEEKKKNIIYKIEKIDNFQNLNAPILRFRSTLKCPSGISANAFADFITNIKHRKRWDINIDNVQELYPVQDLDEINNNEMITAIDKNYGICTKLGVGYCQTKKNFIIDSREQLTMCGIQRYTNTNSAIIWGTEMEDCHNYLFPTDTERHTRARSHLFCATLAPSSSNTNDEESSFDIEYVLQLDSGGNLPTFLTTPVIIDAVKCTFKYAKEFFNGGYDGEIYEYDDLVAC